MSKKQSEKDTITNTHAIDREQANKKTMKKGKSAEEKTKNKAKKDAKKERKRNKKPRRRIFPIWLRIIVVFVLAVIALLAGLMIGFGVLGNGNATDALKIETWQYIVDFVKKE